LLNSKRKIANQKGKATNKKIGGKKTEIDNEMRSPLVRPGRGRGQHTGGE